MFSFKNNKYFCFILVFNIVQFYNCININYSIIAKGASGGLGFTENGTSHGAVATVVVELEKGQNIFVLVGQKGTGSCLKVTNNLSFL